MCTKKMNSIGLIYYEILARRLLVGLRLTVLAPLREPVNPVLLACAICDLLTHPVLCSMALLTVHMSSHACAGRVQENCAWHGHHSCFRQHVSYIQYILRCIMPSPLQ